MPKLSIIPPVCAKGYVTLLAVLVVSALAVSIALSFSGWAISAIKSGETSYASQKSKAITQACAEQALLDIKNTPAKVGTYNLSLDAGTCSYTLINNGGNNRTLQITGLFKNVTRKVLITLNQISPKINLTSWQEVADF